MICREISPKSMNSSTDSMTFPVHRMASNSITSEDGDNCVLDIFARVVSRFVCLCMIDFFISSILLF